MSYKSAKSLQYETKFGSAYPFFTVMFEMCSLGGFFTTSKVNHKLFPYSVIWLYCETLRRI
jgi:hypothetical protein